MPRNVRNFWVEGRADGDRNDVSFGPRASTGGFRLTVKMRDDGGIVNALDLEGIVSADGTITLHVQPNAALALTNGAGVPAEFRLVTRRDAPKVAKG